MDFNALTREMRSDERPLLANHLLALSPEDRHLRFGRALSDDAVRKYVDEIDFGRDVVFVVTDNDLSFLGAAHLARQDKHAEIGVSVQRASRGRGIGAALLQRATVHAQNWGVRVLFMNCLVENGAMMHLARKQGLTIAVSSADAEAFVHLPRADLKSIATEVVAEHLGLFDHALKSAWLALQGRNPSPLERPGG